MYKCCKDKFGKDCNNPAVFRYVYDEFPFYYCPECVFLFNIKGVVCLN